MYSALGQELPSNLLYDFLVRFFLHQIQCLTHLSCDWSLGNLEIFLGHQEQNLDQLVSMLLDEAIERDLREGPTEIHS